MPVNFIRQEKLKLLATLAVAGFFMFFWINGPLLQDLQVINLEQEETEFSKPGLVGERAERQNFGTIEDEETKGFGHGLILDKPVNSENAGIIVSPENDANATGEFVEQLLEHAKTILGNENPLQLKSSDNFYYVSAEGNDKLLYLESKGIINDIHGYAGLINVGVVLSKDGTLRTVHHVSSKETESYLQRMSNRGYYEQYQGLPLEKEHLVDGVSGATITSEAIAKTATALIHEAAPEPLFSFAALEDAEGFAVEAGLSLWWVAHILVILSIFIYGYQKKWRKSKRGIIILSIISVAYIGFFLNNSFTYISFLHPFIGTTVSSLTGLYALFVLLGAIWGKNTYCKYVCPFGNVQRLLLQMAPKKASTKFFIPNKWVKRIRGALAIVLIVGVLLGLRSWSNYELFPDLFGPDFLAMWFFVAIGVVLLSVRYPMLWCRLLCPTGSVLDFVSDSVNYKPKKK
ncbi:MAG: 4Fe-4S binding protein [Bacteroidia bacterium]